MSGIDDTIAAPDATPGPTVVKPDDSVKPEFN